MALKASDVMNKLMADKKAEVEFEVKVCPTCKQSYPVDSESEDEGEE